MNNTTETFRAMGNQWLHKNFASYVKVARTSFSLSGLNDGVARQNLGTRIDTFDHLQYIKWLRHPFGIISHPYGPKEKITESMRKIQHDYPALVALFIDEESWWNDGCTPYIIMRREDYVPTCGTYCVTRSADTNRRG